MATGRTKKQKIVGMLSVSAVIILGLMFSDTLKTGGVADNVQKEWKREEPVVKMAPYYEIQGD